MKPAGSLVPIAPNQRHKVKSPEPGHGMPFDEYVAAVAGTAPALSDDQIEQVRRILHPAPAAKKHGTGLPETDTGRDRSPAAS